MRRMSLLVGLLAFAIAIPAGAAITPPSPTPRPGEDDVWEIYNTVYGLNPGDPGHVTSNQNLHDQHSAGWAEVWAVLDAGGGPVEVQARFAGEEHAFGYYRPTGSPDHPDDYTYLGWVSGPMGYNPEVLDGPGGDPVGPLAVSFASGAPFGLFLDVLGTTDPDRDQLFHSEPHLNPDGFNAMRAYRAPDPDQYPNEFLIAWEDLLPDDRLADNDFNDLVLTIRNVRIVPEPTSMLLLGMGLAGAAVRRLRKKARE